MSELTERLRGVRKRFVPWSSHDRVNITNLCDEAADEIIALEIEKRVLEADNAELRKKYVVTEPRNYFLQGYWRN